MNITKRFLTTTETCLISLTAYEMISRKTDWKYAEINTAGTIPSQLRQNVWGKILV
jgi:hypothetical protein